MRWVAAVTVASTATVAVAAGDNDTRHWHIDYLLGHAATAVDRVVTTEADIECAVASVSTGRQRRGSTASSPSAVPT